MGYANCGYALSGYTISSFALSGHRHLQLRPDYATYTMAILPTTP